MKLTDQQLQRRLDAAWANIVFDADSVTLGDGERIERPDDDDEITSSYGLAFWTVVTTGDETDVSSLDHDSLQLARKTRAAHPRVVGETDR